MKHSERSLVRREFTFPVVYKIKGWGSNCRYRVYVYRLRRALGGWKSRSLSGDFTSNRTVRWIEF